MTRKLLMFSAVFLGAVLLAPTHAIAAQQLIDTFTVPYASIDDVSSSVSLKPGVDYTLEVSGTGRQAHPDGSAECDALYCIASDTGQPYTRDMLTFSTDGGDMGGLAQVGGKTDGDIPYDPGHTYSVPMKPDFEQVTGKLRVDSHGPGAACGKDGLTCEGDFTVKIYGPGTAGGDSDPAVKRLQRALQRLGLYSGPVDGKNDGQVKDAIKRFQRRVGLPVDGDCEARCRKALGEAVDLDDPALPPGAAPKARRTVKELQRDLQKLGFYKGPIDGQNDDALKSAVKAFQRDVGIAADGRCTARCQFELIERLFKSKPRSGASLEVHASHQVREPDGLVR